MLHTVIPAILLSRAKFPRCTHCALPLLGVTIRYGSESPQPAFEATPVSFFFQKVEKEDESVMVEVTSGTQEVVPNGLYERLLGLRSVETSPTR